MSASIQHSEFTIQNCFLDFAIVPRARQGYNAAREGAMTPFAERT